VYILVRNVNKIILLYAFHNSYLHTMTCNMHGETRIYTKLCLKVFTGRKQWGIWYRWDIYIFWDCLLWTWWWTCWFHKCRQFIYQV